MRANFSNVTDRKGLANFAKARKFKWKKNESSFYKGD